MHLSAGSLVLLTLCRFGLTQSKGHFIVPPDPGATLYFDENNVYTIGQTLAVRWSMSLDGYAVWLWQQSLSQGFASQGPSIYTKLAGGQEPGGFNWTVDQHAFDLGQSNVFFLAIDTVQGSITSDTVTSHYFNLTQADASLVTSSASSSSLSSASTSTASSSSATSVSTLSSPTAFPSSSSNATTSATPNKSISSDTILKISIGVSVGLGVPLLALGIYIAVTMGCKQKRSPQSQSPRVSTLAYDLQSNSNLSTSPQEMMASHEFAHMVRNDRTTKYMKSEAVELPVERSGRI